MTCDWVLRWDHGRREYAHRCGLRAGRYCDDCMMNVCGGHWVKWHFAHRVRVVGDRRQ